MLVTQYESKKNRQIFPETVEFAKNCIEVFRLRDFDEHIFQATRSLHDEMIDFELHKKWQLNTYQGFCQSQLTPTLLMFDYATAGKPGSDWQETDIDFPLLNKIGFNKCYRLA